MCTCQSLSRVRLFVTPWIVARQAPLSLGILQARRLEWVAMPFSRGSSQPRDRTQVSCMQAGSLPSEPQGSPVYAQLLSVLLFYVSDPVQTVLTSRIIFIFLPFKKEDSCMVLTVGTKWFLLSYQRCTQV